MINFDLFFRKYKIGDVMRKIVLFIAMSLDGYIADKEGKVDWLQDVKESEDDMTSYNEFIKDIDTVLM